MPSLVVQKRTFCCIEEDSSATRRDHRKRPGTKALAARFTPPARAAFAEASRKKPGAPKPLDGWRIRLRNRQTGQPGLEPGIAGFGDRSLMVDRCVNAGL